MNKKISFLLLIISLLQPIYGQIGIGTTNPNAKSILDVYSTNRGLLFPRLTNAQMINLETGGLAEGMVIYNLSLKQFMGWDGEKWQNLGYEETNTVPTTSGVILNGNFETGEIISASYSFNDGQNDPNDASYFEFQRADDHLGANMNVISSGISTGSSNNDSYSLTAAEEGKYLRYCLTPSSNSGASPGTTVCSAWNGPSTAPNVPPAVSSVSISGNQTEGQTLTGNYSYSDDDGDSEGASTFRWTRADDASGTNESTIAGETLISYNLAAADVAKFIKFYITPVAASGASPGTEVGSAFVGPIADGISSLPFAESFETDGLGTRYTSFPATQYSDGDADYFTRTNGTSPAISANFLGSPDGSFYFAGQDLDAESGAPNPSTLTITGIAITGETNLTLTVALAEDDAPDGNEDYDNGNSGDNNYIWFEVQIDGGGYQKVLAVESSSAAGSSNGEPRLDTNFDGVGNGSPITQTWSDFSANITGTGNTLDLRITMNLDDGDEDIAIDNIRITGP
ncbi:MAG: hypothetical protein ACPG4W_08335 [Flavobacteriales bacterium]